MVKIVDFIVKRRIIILAIFILLALCSIFLMLKVNVNSDMTKYLPESSATKKGISIMDDEFPAASTVNLMIKGLNEEEKTKIYDELLKIDNVESVSYEQKNESYNKDGYTLYILTINSGAFSSEAETVVNTIKDQYSSYDITLSGEAAGKNLGDILAPIFSAALVLLFIILFIMCNSWIEPFLFIITIAVAVLINMGTNIIFSSVSDITQSIAAILQLVLSMDYSIMLINRYRQEKQTEDDILIAMKKALRHSVTAISSSSVTTIVGMLALVFMSFTIGRDLGLVLAKGVFLSLLCIFTVLPALILMFDKIIVKTTKKSLHIKMDKLASFSYKARYVISILFVILFAVSYFLQGSVNIDYTLTEFSEVRKVFDLNNPIIVLYENSDEDKIAGFIAKWETNSFIDSINSYPTTIGKELDYMEFADTSGMDKNLTALIYNYYFNGNIEPSNKKITLGELIQFIKKDVASNELFAPYFNEDVLAQLNAIGSGSSEQLRLSPDEFAAYSGMAPEVVKQIFGYYFNLNGQTADGKIALDDLIPFLTTTIAANEQFSPYFTPDILTQLDAMSAEPDNNIMETELSSADFAEYAGLDKATAALLYDYYEIVHGEVPQGKITLYDFIIFITEELVENEQFKPYFTEDILKPLNEAKTEIDEGLTQLVGEHYSRLIINTNLPEESDDTFDFIKTLEQDMDETLPSEHYIIGDSAMAYEMSNSFPSEMNMITILTAVAIFLVVAIAFRSLSIPLILVCVIQCAVFITMGTIYIQGSRIYYLPLIIVECLLMGATIDYGILYTSYYREARKTLEKKAAITHALNNAVHTILTSGLILIIVTMVIGIFIANSDPAISSILLTIAKGGICSTILVIFILPSLVSALDKFVCGKKKTVKILK